MTEEREGFFFEATNVTIDLEVCKKLAAVYFHIVFGKTMLYNLRECLGTVKLGADEDKIVCLVMKNVRLFRCSHFFPNAVEPHVAEI